VDPPAAPLVAALPVDPLEAAPSAPPLSAKAPLMGCLEVAAATAPVVGQVWVSLAGDLPAPLVGSLVVVPPVPCLDPTAGAIANLAAWGIPPVLWPREPAAAAAATVLLLLFLLQDSHALREDSLVGAAATASSEGDPLLLEVGFLEAAAPKLEVCWVPAALGVASSVAVPPLGVIVCWVEGVVQTAEVVAACSEAVLLLLVAAASLVGAVAQPTRLEACLEEGQQVLAAEVGETLPMVPLGVVPLPAAAAAALLMQALIRSRTPFRVQKNQAREASLPRPHRAPVEQALLPRHPCQAPEV